MREPNTSPAPDDHAARAQHKGVRRTVTVLVVVVAVFYLIAFLQIIMMK